MRLHLLLASHSAVRLELSFHAHDLVLVDSWPVLCLCYKLFYHTGSLLLQLKLIVYLLHAPFIQSELFMGRRLPVYVSEA